MYRRRCKVGGSSKMKCVCFMFPFASQRTCNLTCLFQKHGELKFSTVLPQRPVDVRIVLKKKKNLSKNNHRALPPRWDFAGRCSNFLIVLVQTAFFLAALSPCEFLLGSISCIRKRVGTCKNYPSYLFFSTTLKEVSGFPLRKNIVGLNWSLKE